MKESYIHGFSREEQQRLVRQAEVLAPNVFAGLPLNAARDVLEVGCGVGAELRLLLARWPHLKLTGLDRNPSHLAAARDLLAAEIEAGRIKLEQADAQALPFENASFDAVLTIWMLEHIHDPEPILREAMRVTRPEGRIILTEVDNDTFRFHPRIEPIADWWHAFNECQCEAGGNPVVGRELAGHARRLGARNLHERSFPNVSSRHEPVRRRVLLDYLEELLLSGASSLMESGRVGDADRLALRAAFERVRHDAAIEFEYWAYRVEFQPPSAQATACKSPWPHFFPCDTLRSFFGGIGVSS